MHDVNPQVLYGNAMLLGLLLVVEALAAQGLVAAEAADPSPTPWPEQFHAQIHQNTSGKLSTIELWYDWPNGRNLNIIQEQLGVLLYDLEWTNGTSYVYYYDLAAESCFSIKFPVGILRPDWLVDDSHYLGVREVDGFSCHAWEKADFITYYEDVASKRPVHWLFFNGNVNECPVSHTLGDQSPESPSRIPSVLCVLSCTPVLD